MTPPPLSLLRAAVLLLGFVAAAALGWWLLQPHTGPLRLHFQRYRLWLQGELNFAFLHIDAGSVLRQQGGALGAILLITLVLGNLWLGLLLTPAALWAPALWLRQLRRRRTLRIEAQLDAFLTVLANALRASPSLGEALASSVELVSAPLSQELDLTVKAMHLGTPLQAALRQMVQRIGSRSVGAAITTLQVAQRTGGNLPQTLETAAAALREMARLEGVVRTKTAEGRSQLMVLAAIPFGLGAAIYAISPESLAPLWTTPAGYLLLAIATALWLGALLLARKILAVDI